MNLSNDQNIITVIIQARMTSTRLPKKVLLNLGNKTVLEHVVERCKKSRYVSNVVVASPESSESIPIEKLCFKNGVEYFVGSENDVLKRYYNAAVSYKSNIIVRVTSDCPLIDPNIIDIMLQEYLTAQNLGIKYDYYSNVVKRSLPRGLDVEIFSFSALESINNDAISLEDREHVTRYIYTNPDKFNIGHYVFPNNLSEYRVTLDTEDDFKMLNEFYLKANYLGIENIYLPDIISILKKFPEINQINSNVKQKEV